MTHMKHTLLTGVSKLNTASINDGGFRLPPMYCDGKLHSVLIEKRNGITTTYIDGKARRESWFSLDSKHKLSVEAERANVKRLLAHLDKTLTPLVQDYLFYPSI